jgi:hypothetical protein
LKNLKIQTGTGSNRPVSVRFGFFNRKTGKPVLIFFGLFNGFSDGLSDGLVINVNII